MSTRWMAVQFVGNTLRLPVVNDGEMDKPFGSSVIDREISRVVINPFSDSPQAFVSESENAKLRELVRNLYAEWVFARARMRYVVLQHEERMRGIEQRMRELGVEP